MIGLEICDEQSIAGKPTHWVPIQEVRRLRKRSRVRRTVGFTVGYRFIDPSRHSDHSISVDVVCRNDVELRTIDDEIFDHPRRDAPHAGTEAVDCETVMQRIVS